MRNKYKKKQTEYKTNYRRLKYGVQLGVGRRKGVRRKGVRDDFWYMSRTNSQNIPLVIPDPFFLF